MTTLQAGVGGIVVWGMFFWSTLGPLVSVDTTLNSTAYLNIISDYVHSFMAIKFPYGDGHIKKDNAPGHSARSFTNLFEENQSTCFKFELPEFNLLPCPDQSPDLNPMGHLRDEVERSLRSLETPPSNLTQLRVAIISDPISLCYGPKFLSNVIRNLLNPCQEEYRL
ncbi:hypothetical protein AVEN_59630-1 [Araneus ventricosus]|uniref:Tc1-like transposase DDE domain-containing protein n=1 Tax=Araneus ventricosus TaxID=182803 RepID=A0A4Y2LX05_ARAVE|nr:hypothetical protein AVEN_59630-1 [Araneus ventricosus]